MTKLTTTATMNSVEKAKRRGLAKLTQWRNDWPLFAKEVLGVNLDDEQNEILSSVQTNPRTAVASGTARGKDFVAAVAAMCFMYLTPRWNKQRELIANTKVALTAPTDRQVKNIMMPEISRLYNRAKRRKVPLPGRLNAYDIRTDNEEWFLTGFKADEHNHEAWSGFHAVNTMFIVTEASGISDDTFGAIEGNLQGNSRILLVFNPNQVAGYAAKAMKGARWSKFRLNSMTAPNVKLRKQVIPGQVDYEWVVDKVENWCTLIREDEVKEDQDDFQFEGPDGVTRWYRPDDIFRIKVLGKFPKTGIDSLIPEQWIEAAQKRWVLYHKTKRVEMYPGRQRIGVDVAGMGRDSSVECHRHDNIVEKFNKSNSGGVPDHMAITGRVVEALRNDPEAMAFVDTIGEGAGVISRTNEQNLEDRAISCKYSESATDPDTDEPLTDVTGEYKFANMRAYLFWAVRDWLNPENGQNAMLPPGDTFREEATEIKWKVQSNGLRIIEPKEDIQKRLKRSTDEFDALANTFYPKYYTPKITNYNGMFR